MGLGTSIKEYLEKGFSEYLSLSFNDKKKTENHVRFIIDSMTHELAGSLISLLARKKPFGMSSDTYTVWKLTIILPHLPCF